jgi:8-hydroxy-5-deazaflavin:NADPH oxidoreductase
MQPGATLVNIAIIGTGAVGTALAGSLVSAGHRVTITARDSQGIAVAVATTGAHPAPTPVAAVTDSDVVFLAVPFGSGHDVAAEIAAVSDGKVIVDVTNPAKPDWSGPLFEGTSSGAEQFAAWLPKARIVKAFNTIFASNLPTARIDGFALDAYIAGDDDAAKADVAALAESMGFHPVDVGTVTAARMLEAVAWLNISLNARGGNWQSGWKLLGLAA